MKKFIFRFETLLNLRKRKEEALSIELANIISTLNKERLTLNALNVKNKEMQKKLKDKNKKESINISELLMYERYISFIKETIQKQTQKVNVLSNKEKETRTRLIVASKEKKVLEKLKEKLYLKYITEFEKQESKMLDEMGSIRYAYAKI